LNGGTRRFELYLPTPLQLGMADDAGHDAILLVLDIRFVSQDGIT
jgi:hypothetical protein